MHIYYRVKQINDCHINTLIEHSSNKSFIAMLLILEHSASIMGSMKRIIGRNFGKFQKEFGKVFEHN